MVQTVRKFLESTTENLEAGTPIPYSALCGEQPGIIVFQPCGQINGRCLFLCTALQSSALLNPPVFLWVVPLLQFSGLD